jgi:hypothetical protein
VQAKLKQLFMERMHRSVHVFADSGKRWHCFILSFADIAGAHLSGEHHWQGGSHIHYISHLFGRLSKENVWQSLDERDYSLPTVHIRFSAQLSADPGVRYIADERVGKATAMKLPP